MRVGAGRVAAYLCLVLLAGCRDEPELRIGLGEDFDDEAQTVSFCAKMNGVAARFAAMPAQEQAKLAAGVKQALVDRKQAGRDSALGELYTVSEIISRYGWTPAGDKEDEASRAEAQACQKAALAMRPFIAELASGAPALSEVVRPYAGETEYRTKSIVEAAGKAGALAGALLNDAEKFARAAKESDEFAKRSWMARFLQVMPKEKRLRLYETAAARTDERIVVSLRQVAFLDAGLETDGGVHGLISALETPLYTRAYYKYGPALKDNPAVAPGTAAVVEDTWLGCYVLPFLPEMRAADAARKERWDAVIKRLKPALVALAAMREPSLRDLVNRMAGHSDDKVVVNARDVLKRLPDLEKLAEELRAQK